MDWQRLMLALAVLSSPHLVLADTQTAVPGRDVSSSHAALARGYRYDRNGNRGQAWLWYRRAAALATNAAEYDRSCMGVVYDAPLQRKRLPEPWYMTFYADPMWMQRSYVPTTPAQQKFSDFLLQSKLRLGRYLDSSHRASVYAYATYNSDSASHGGDVPQIYNDNFAGIGVGVDYRPLPGWRLYAEVGPDYDLTYRQRPRWRTDLTFGAEYYGAWGAGTRCTYRPEWPLHPFSDLYASVARYSRYDGNVIGQLTARGGVRLFQDHFTNVSAYVLVNVTADSQHLYYNNVIEIGPGLSWRPNIAWPLSLRLEYRFGHYWRNLPADYTSQYRTLMLQAIFYFEQ